MNVSELTKEWKEARGRAQTLPAKLQGEYRLDACLKYAREQQVYRLLRTWDDAPFLLKAAQGHAAPLLREEYRFLKELGLPFLPKAMDCFEEEGRVYLLREYLPGKTLYDMVEVHGALPPPRAVRLALWACQMLHVFHTRRPPLIHRDIKPQNILYSPQGTCFLLDVGSLGYYEPQKAQDTVAIPTQATAAPEQPDVQQWDVRTDVYAVGKLLYYLLAGHFPADEPDLGEAPAGLRRVLRKSLSFSPGKRYQSAAKLEKALRRWLRLRGLRPALLSLAGLLLVSCCLGLGFFAGRAALPVVPAEAAFSTQAAALTGAASPQEPAVPVVFAEPKIQEAVRLVLGKGDDEPIFAKELGRVWEIVICGDRVYPDAESHRSDANMHWANHDPKGPITSLEDLLLMPNLETVIIDRQPVSDLEPLAKLRWLENVSLCQCLVRDIAPLARCLWLQELTLDRNPLRDLSPVSTFHSLKVLRVPETKVTDISALRGMELEELNISDLSIEDYSVLDTLSLRRFYGTYLPESSIPSLARMPKMETLSIAFTHCRDLRPFAAYPALEYLNILGCTIDDLSDLSGFPLLKFVDMYSIRLPSLTPFLALPKLERMILSHATIKDISALPRFTGLKELLVDPDWVERIAQTFPGVTFPFEITLY